MRTIEQKRRHYEIERELARKLRCATREERKELYGTVYKELYARVPDIPHLIGAGNGYSRAMDVAKLLGFLERFLIGKQTFLEIGPGDFKLSMAVSKLVPKVFAVDVTDEVRSGISLPSNVTFLESDGCHIPVPANCIDVALSDQVMEHLHPDDAESQLESIYNALAPGGAYICITPNRLYGPHDISRYFDPVATGLHLREYSVTEVIRMFKRVDFAHVKAYSFTQRISRFPVPTFAILAIEKTLDALPVGIRRSLAFSSGLKWIMRSRVVGMK